MKTKIGSTTVDVVEAAIMQEQYDLEIRISGSLDPE